MSAVVTVWRGMALFLQTTLAPGARVAAVQLAVPCPAVSLTLVSATFPVLYTSTQGWMPSPRSTRASCRVDDAGPPR